MSKDKIGKGRERGKEKMEDRRFKAGLQGEECSGEKEMKGV